MVPATSMRQGALAACSALLGTLLIAGLALAQSPDPQSSPQMTGEPVESLAPVSSEEPMVGPWPSTPLDAAEAVTSRNGLFVAVGGDGDLPAHAEAWTSTDGIDWQPATIADAPDGSVMSAVTATDGGFIAVGTVTSEGADGPDRVAAWRSADGVTWERGQVQRARRQGLGAGIRGLADGPGGLLALATFFAQDAGPFRLYQSADGTDWAPVDLPDVDNVIWSTITSIPDGYLLVGNTFRGQARTFRSGDGRTWERVADAPWMLDAAAGADGTVVGIGDMEIYRTQDLATWELVWENPDTSTDGEPSIDWVEWDGSRFAASGHGFEGCPENVDECYQSWLLLSPDGTTWTASEGVDGVPGPDQATRYHGIASDGTTTVVLALDGPDPTSAFVMPQTAAGTG